MRYQKIKPRMSRPAERAKRVKQITGWLTAVWSLLLSVAIVLCAVAPDHHWGFGIAIIASGVLDVALSIAVAVLHSKVPPLPWYMEVEGVAVGEKQYEKDKEGLKTSLHLSLLAMLMLSLVVPTLLVLHVFGMI